MNQPIELSSEIHAFHAELSAFTRENFEERLPQLYGLRERHYKAEPAVDIERAWYMTDYLRKHEHDGEPMQVRRAEATAHYMTHRGIHFHDDNLLGGATTGKEIGAAVYPEFLGLSIWPELDSIGRRPDNPLRLSDEDAEKLNLEVFPYWLDRTVAHLVRKEDPKRQGWLEKLVIYTISKAATLSHTTPSYRLALEKGIDGIISEAKEKEAAAGGDTHRRDFYRSMQSAMAGLKRYANRVSERARAEAETARAAQDTARVKIFESMAEVCAKVPAGPPSSYREALNSVLLCQVGVLAENVNMAINPGRLDQLLYRFFIEDYKAGKLSIAEALTLTGCLWLKLADNVNLVPEASERLFGGAGAVPAITVGGVTAEGKDAVNELTFLMLKVTELLGIRDPNVNARFHPDVNPEAYRDEVARVILSTKAIPAMYNDIENIAALENQLKRARSENPEARAHANDHAIIGCVELGSQGRDYSASSSIFMMMSTILYMALHEGRTSVTGDEAVGPATGDPASFTTFDDVWNAYVEQTRWMVENTVALNNLYGKKHQEMLPTPLLSCLFEGPMEAGKDLIHGGALYNSSGVTHIGFADVCDSLCAIQDVCFNPKNTVMHRSLPELIAAVDANFEGHDVLHAYLSGRAPKYGTDNPVAQEMADKLIALEYELFDNRQNYRGGNYRPAYWTMTNHAGYGYVSKALPSGRKDGEVFSSGITPVSQLETALTDALNSVARLDSEQIPGAYALNIKLSPMPATSDNAAKLGGLVEGYMRSGGQQIQFNIQDYKTLQETKELCERLKAENADLSRYPHLVVRVSGYSAYFEALGEVMQDELITRSQYDLQSGKLVKLSTRAGGAS